ncbi:MAG: discoidin domain-containing protein [Actinomycetota bacterium]|nr:discoidin domain-containing protein [Actinomycetota bacterium]
MTQNRPNPMALIRGVGRPGVRMLAAVAVLALVAAACSGSSDDTGSTSSEVRPFTDIQSSEFDFGYEERGLPAMTVATDVAVVCSIAWGETEDLGNLNTDLDMGGTGHAEHDVLLPGAEAGKTYFYRVQGSGSDGTLYQSEIATFTLPDAPDAAATTAEMGGHGDNLAEGATLVEVSSEFSEAWSGENAIDGDLATEWATSGSGDDAFIVIDLGESREVAGVEFLTRSMSDGSAIASEYTVTVDDGETFGPFPAGDAADSMFSEAQFSGRVIRFDVAASTGGNTGAIEVRVFAPTG